MTVSNHASFHGDAITLDDTYAFGSLTFNSLGAVEIIETDATILRGISTADRLYLSSGGSITEDGDPDADVVADTLTIQAAGGVNLDTKVTGLAGLTNLAGGDVDLENEGTLTVRAPSATRAAATRCLPLALTAT